MLDKLKALWRVFQAGQVVADPVLWKSRQITASAVAGLLAALVALAKVFGYEIPLSDDALLQIGGTAVALFGLFNTGITVASTDKIGLSGSKPTSSVGLPVPAIPPTVQETVSPVSDARYTNVLPGLTPTTLREHLNTIDGGTLTVTCRY